MATTLMMSAKMATLGLLKIRVFWNKGYDVMRLWELKIKVRKFLGLVPTFVEVTREKLVKNWFVPPSWIGSMRTPMEGCFCTLMAGFLFYLICLFFKKTNFLYFKGTVMQIEKSLKNDRLRVSKVSWKFCILTIYNFCSNIPVKFAIFLKSSLLFNSFNNVEIRTAMNAKISVFFICVEAMIYLLLQNLQDCI